MFNFLMVRSLIMDTIVILFFMIYSIHIRKYENSKSDFINMAMGGLMFVIFGLLTEITVNANPRPVILNDIFHYCYLVFAVICMFTYYKYIVTLVFSREKAVRPIRIGMILSIVSIICLFIFGIEYEEGSVTNYSLGIGPTISFGFAFVIFITADIILIIRRKTVNTYIRHTIIPISVIGIVFLIIQILFPECLIAENVMTLIIIGVFFSVENPIGKNQEQKRILKEMNDRLLEEKERADLANKAKSQFLANMSHEIRTPINAVLGLDTLILRESKEANIISYANDIQSSGKTLLALINEILDFSKIESGKMELVCAEYQVTDIVNDVVNMIRPKVDEKGLDFILEIDENIPSKMYGDEVRIRQVIVNLLTNAVKYTHSGYVKLKIDAVCNDNNASLTVSVRDTGIGIKAEDISKLSEEFVRIEESRNRNIEGTGLGMNIVISILKLMDSKIEVDSVYGEGSNFYFTISQPIIDKKAIGKTSNSHAKLNTEKGYTAAFCIPDCKLLVVDDTAMNRKVFIKLLKDMKCQIDEAKSGFECLDMVQKTKYDVIFMDHMMPDMDGVETFEHMKEFGEYINAETPVIILTANAISGAKEEYLSKGFSEYLSKPIDVNKLEALIGKFIPDNKKQISEQML